MYIFLFVFCFFDFYCFCDFLFFVFYYVLAFKRWIKREQDLVIIVVACVVSLT